MKDSRLGKLKPLYLMLVGLIVFELVIYSIVQWYRVYLEGSGADLYFTGKTYNKHLILTLKEDVEKQAVRKLLIETGLVFIPQNWKYLLNEPTLKYVEMSRFYGEETQESNQLILDANNEIRKLGVNSEPFGFGVYYKNYTSCNTTVGGKCVEGYKPYIYFDLEKHQEKLIPKLEEIAIKYNLEITIQSPGREYIIYVLPFTANFYEKTLKKYDLVKYVFIEKIEPLQMPFSPLLTF